MSDAEFFRMAAEQGDLLREETHANAEARAAEIAAAARRSKADVIGDEWDAMDAPYNDGWQVR
jgi:hypothetical protein